ncbi:uncharacterized protein E0L32_004554 [Thyridium curvatum]|uniref:C2H2-type domain-containing protein n=1 Tax=Thyridium curvatum TaxID=1093900 RepID=A0A507B679_9PEZI|nr:uncharacterized protein E0L32_004554 [Thyridium curvatum]TPX15277.1 hypothetical protein E0L32_004554 [Thyridium curvatum]
MPYNDYFECGTCGKGFPNGWRARENHCWSVGHCLPNFECDTCHRGFNTQNACIQHMGAMNHFAHECSVCGETWPTEEECIDHEADEHYYCASCDRWFQNANNVKMHRRSRAHLGQPLDCPFCQDPFTTATGVVHHLESGRCPRARGLSRDAIYKFVRARDPNGVVTKKLVGWEGSYEYEANENCWNGYCYECYICHREFKTLDSLNQHLKSPTHQQALYHCPNPNCRLDFKVLAGLFNHLDSESCGMMRFEQVQKEFVNIVSGARRIAF